MNSKRVWFTAYVIGALVLSLPASTMAQDIVFCTNARKIPP
ncbi:MAG: hypothetical protein ACFFEF_12750 [Candidatus Thorarchaeota archaeon]